MGFSLRDASPTVRPAIRHKNGSRHFLPLRLGIVSSPRMFFSPRPEPRDVYRCAQRFQMTNEKACGPSLGRRGHVCARCAAATRPQPILSLPHRATPIIYFMSNYFSLWREMLRSVPISRFLLISVSLKCLVLASFSRFGVRYRGPSLPRANAKRTKCSWNNYSQAFSASLSCSLNAMNMQKGDRKWSKVR